MISSRLPAPEPDDSAGNNHQARQKDQATEKQFALLRFGEDHAPGSGVFGPHGDEVLILR
jgi:hypothetical protein